MVIDPYPVVYSWPGDPAMALSLFQEINYEKTPKIAIDVMVTI